MKQPSPELKVAHLLRNISFSLLFAMIFPWICFVFFSYRGSSGPVLPPAEYTFDLVTREEFSKLFDPAIREDRLSDGRRFVKAPGWEDRMSKYYVPTSDGQQYLLVTPKSTALMVQSWVVYALLPSIIIVNLLVQSLRNYRNVARLTQPELAVSNAGPLTVR